MRLKPPQSSNNSSKPYPTGVSSQTVWEFGELNNNQCKLHFGMPKLFCCRKLITVHGVNGHVAFHSPEKENRFNLKTKWSSAAAVRHRALSLARPHTRNGSGIQLEFITWPRTGPVPVSSSVPVSSLFYAPCDPT
jgi:hypothetical protein